MTDRLTVGDLVRLGLDTVIVAGTDMQGRLFGKRMSRRVFTEKVEVGLNVCTCVLAWDMAQSLEGLHVEFAGAHTGWQDFQLKPDLSTLRRAAWLEDTAICLADCLGEDDELLPVAPRSILRRQLALLSQASLTAFAATELEFYLYVGTPRQLRAQGFRAMTPTTDVHADYNITEGNAMEPFFRGLRRALDDSGVPVEVAQVEYGLGQWEINLEYAEALEMADRHVLFKQAVKDHAGRHGYTATFMPRPITDDLGSSCHIHASLRDQNGHAMFHDPAADRSVSAALRHAVGGVLQHAPSLMAWYAPTVNAYRRTISQDFAGNGLTWGFDNRTVTTRVLTGSPFAARLEFRLPGADVNPYLALAALLASARDGIDSQLDPGPPSTGDAYRRGAAQALPRSLPAAAQLLGADPFPAAAFGGDVVRHYQAVAEYESDSFARAVTDWERDRYPEGI